MLTLLMAVDADDLAQWHNQCVVPVNTKREGKSRKHCFFHIQECLQFQAPDRKTLLS